MIFLTGLMFEAYNTLLCEIPSVPNLHVGVSLQDHPHHIQRAILAMDGWVS